jgi:hypothetical protein
MMTGYGWNEVKKCCCVNYKLASEDWPMKYEYVSTVSTIFLIHFYTM